MFRTLPLFLVVSIFVTAQSVAHPISLQQKQKKAAKVKTEEVDAEEAQQRAVAISLVTTLADEAKTFKDQTRRARVQARAADVLWETEPERARELFHRAWEAAEAVDADTARQRAAERKRLEASGEPVVQRGGVDLRSEVLRLAAKRDRRLGEEFLKALDEANDKERERSPQINGRMHLRSSDRQNDYN